jgi:hypothetical protein
MEIEAVVSDVSREDLNSIQGRLETTREKMETETLAFIEATKTFTSKWIQREIEIAVNSQENGSCPETLRSELKKSGELNLDINEFSMNISDIVETHLNLDDYWIHRNSLFQPDISKDYVEFQKGKIRSELTSRIRIILGCATEIFWNLEEGESKNKSWVKEMGRRKYVCFLRFSDEMTASLNHYFELLETLLVLNHKLKEEMSKIDEK